MTPEVSVIVPVLNGERFVAAAMSSVLIQTQGDLELIVVDDGSTDTTSEIIRSFDDSRIRAFWQENAGLAAARNRGLAEARSPLIAFLDADDEWFSHKLAAQVPLAARQRLVYSDVLFWQEETGEPIGSYEVFDRFPKDRSKFDGAVVIGLLAQNFVHPSTVVIHKQDLLAAGGFDESLRVAEDWDLWLRLADKTEFIRVSEPLVRVRRRKDSLQSNPAAMTEGATTVLINATARLRASDAMDDRKRYAIGLGFFAGRAMAEARSELARALLRRPWELARWRWMIAALVRPMLDRVKP